MTERLIVDSSALVAFLAPDEEAHEWAKRSLDRCESAVLTCEAVLTESAFLLRRRPRGVAGLLTLLDHGFIDLPFRLADEVPAVRTLMTRYADVPMSLADACLVRMSELLPRWPVMTLDSDFKRYRRNRRQLIPLLMP